MQRSKLILVASVLLIGTGAAHAAQPMVHGGVIKIPAPSIESVTPPMESAVPPPVNSGALGAPSEFGLPSVNSGAIAPLAITNEPNFGALPGSPGSPVYNPTAALPSLDNAGSALAPNPGTSASGFGSPNTNTGTTPSLNNGG